MRQTENPCVGGSIPPLGTTSKRPCFAAFVTSSARYLTPGYDPVKRPPGWSFDEDRSTAIVNGVAAP
jgi:hypothetical protein